MADAGHPELHPEPDALNVPLIVAIGAAATALSVLLIVIVIAFSATKERSERETKRTIVPIAQPATEAQMTRVERAARAVIRTQDLAPLGTYTPPEAQTQTAPANDAGTDNSSPEGASGNGGGSTND